MSLAQVSEVTGGRIAGPPMAAGALIHGVATDSRKDCEGKMFVALTGPRFDGHEHVESARRNGAVAAMLEHQTAADIPMVLVDNTLESLGRTAAWWRGRFDIPVIGITGSVGKTTVKELLGAILSQEGEGIVTEGNLNNEIGVPLTLTRLADHHHFAVVEMGMNQAGEISRLSCMSRPTVAVINNAAEAHLEGLGSVEAVAAAKGEIIQGVPLSGAVVLNADDDWFEFWRDLAGPRRVISFGLDASANITARYTLLGDHTDMVVTLGGDALQVRLPLAGRHNVCNALAAIAAASTLDVSADNIKRGLESGRNVAGRLGISLVGGVTVIDDTYNANPASMQAAIEVLSDYPGARRILVIGDMGELGEAGPQAHRDVGHFARSHGIDQLYAFGPMSAMAVAASDIFARHYDDKRQLTGDLLEELRDGDVVLVKGSRSTGMEEVVGAITAAMGADSECINTRGGSENAA